MPHFPHDSLIPLALSGLPPAFALFYSIFKQRAVDFLGLIGAENVVVDLLAIVLSHGEHAALLGRALQNPILALFFLGSLVTGKPLVLAMSRQLSTGNDPAKRVQFDAVASQPHALRTYRFMTWVWVAAMLIKGAGSVVLADLFNTKDYLVFNPMWSLSSDILLFVWSMLYGRAKLVEK